MPLKKETKTEIDRQTRHVVKDRKIDRQTEKKTIKQKNVDRQARQARLKIRQNNRRQLDIMTRNIYKLDSRHAVKDRDIDRQIDR